MLNVGLYIAWLANKGQHIDIAHEAIVIGRNSTRSNLVLSSDDISLTHIKVLRDTADCGVWIEDLNSTNGTFYRKANPETSSSWIQLSGSMLLAPGDIFRLSGGEAVFEVTQH